jgi:putative selenate reductase molybdopterin-binding subunit
MQCIHHNHASIDGKGLIHGKPAYADDLAEINALTIKVLRSPHAFAKISDIQFNGADQLPGVECILTHKDFKRIPVTRAGQGYPEPSPHDKFVLDHVVRHVGDEVLAVAGRTEQACEAALKLIQVTYEVLEPVLDFEKAYGHSSIIHAEEEAHEMFPIGFDPKNNVAATYLMNVGDVNEDLKACDVVLKHTFYTHAQAHAMMEPHNVNAKIDYQGRLILISSTQTPFHTRRIVSMALDYPMSKIRVIKPRVGGGYGGKQCVHGEMIVAAVTLKTGKPSKLVYTREEVFESSFSRHPMKLDVTLGSSADGTLKAIDMHILSDTGAYGEHALTVFMVAGSKVLPLYNKVKSVRFEGRIVYTNHTPGGAFRGYGAIQGNFALESAIDMLCEKLHMDPIAFRQKNMIAENETSPIFAIMGEGTAGTAMNMDSCKLDYCVSRGRELIQWDKKYPRVVEGNKVRGVGMAIAMQGSGIPKIDMASAIIKFNDDGFFNLLIGATDIGQGSDTVLAQIAAETLMVPLEKMIVYSSDTDLTPFDTGAYASSTTYVSGNAVVNAAQEMKHRLIKEGAHALELEIDQVVYDGVSIKSIIDEQEITLAALGNRLFYNEDQKQLVASGSYVGTKSPPPFMAGFAEVEIDKLTGRITVLDYVAVVDCGATLNPNLAKGQVEGALVQGIGMTLYEEVIINERGKQFTNNFMNYRIPTRKEIHDLRVEFASSYEESGPYGAKSVGEIGIDTPPAAICNAIYNAIGVRIDRLPATSEKVFMEMLKRRHL